MEWILSVRGIGVTHESTRQWCLKFSADIARKLRQRRSKPGDTRHLDDAIPKINDELHYFWRALDQHEVALDILLQRRRNAAAAKRFFKRLLAGLKYKPKRIATDGLRSYGVARRRERQMQRLKSQRQAQRFRSSHAMTYGHFRPRQHLMTAVQHRRARTETLWVLRQET